MKFRLIKKKSDRVVNELTVARVLRIINDPWSRGVTVHSQKRNGRAPPEDRKADSQFGNDVAAFRNDTVHEQNDERVKRKGTVPVPN